MPASDATHDTIRAVLPHLQGWCTPEKAAVLADLVTDLDVQCAVEVGVFGGSSLLPMAIAARAKGSGTVWGVDPWTADAALEGKNAVENDEWWSQLDYHAVYRGFVRAVVDNDLLDVCTWLKVRSDQAVQLFADGSVQLLHIDGNHSELTSVRDVALWYPKLAPGGVVVVDDVNWASTNLAVQYLRGMAADVADHGTYAVFSLAAPSAPPPTSA